MLIYGIDWTFAPSEEETYKCIAQVRGNVPGKWAPCGYVADLFYGGFQPDQAYQAVCAQHIAYVYFATGLIESYYEYRADDIA